MNNNYEIKLEKKKQKHFYLFEDMWGYNVWFQKISMPPPPHGRSLEIPRGRGGSKAVIEG